MRPLCVSGCVQGHVVIHHGSWQAFCEATAGGKGPTVDNPRPPPFSPVLAYRVARISECLKVRSAVMYTEDIMFTTGTLCQGSRTDIPVKWTFPGP